MCFAKQSKIGELLKIAKQPKKHKFMGTTTNEMAESNVRSSPIVIGIYHMKWFNFKTFENVGA